MEYLDIYDEFRNFLGTRPRDEVHRDALWHNNIHCWLYDKLGNVYFQIRSNSKKFYTTASGHVLSKETLEEAFSREIKEELGIFIDKNNNRENRVFSFDDFLVQAHETAIGKYGTVLEKIIDRCNN